MIRNGENPIKNMKIYYSLKTLTKDSIYDLLNKNKLFRQKREIKGIERIDYLVFHSNYLYISDE